MIILNKDGKKTDEANGTLKLAGFSTKNSKSLYISRNMIEI